MSTRREDATPHESAEAVVRQFGRKIAGARVERGLTQVQLAALAATSPTRVAEIERAISTPRLDTLVRIASAVGLQVTLTPAA